MLNTCEYDAVLSSAHPPLIVMIVLVDASGFCTTVDCYILNVSFVCCFVLVFFFFTIFIALCFGPRQVCEVAAMSLGLGISRLW